MSTATTDRVSVVIPARNAERYLPAAVRSVFGQVPRPHELIIVDDGSTDRTVEVARSLGPDVVVLQAGGVGGAGATNVGIERCRGELVTFIDADDLWAAGKLAAQLAALDADPELSLAFGHERQFVSPDLTAEEAAMRHPKASGPMRARGTLMARREVFELHGGFDPGLRLGEFVAWYGVVRAGGVRDLMLDRVLLLRRLHTSNTTRDRGSYDDYARAIRIAFDAARRSGVQKGTR